MPRVLLRWGHNGQSLIGIESAFDAQSLRRGLDAETRYRQGYAPKVGRKCLVFSGLKYALSWLVVKGILFEMIARCWSEGGRYGC